MATEISPPTAFTTTVIFTMVGVVVTDVTVIVVITINMNNLFEMAMKRSCVEAYPERPLPAFQNMRVSGQLRASGP